MAAELLLGSPGWLVAGALGAAAMVAAFAWWARRRGRGAVTAATAKAGPPDAQAGLPQRARFEALLQAGLIATEKAGRDGCVLYAGLDGLRLVHDNFGNEFCDRVLAAVGDRLHALCGMSTPLARIGGDEFAVWLDAPREAGEKLAARLVDAFAGALVVEGRELSLGLSVGLALAPEHGSSVRLLAKAAAAMHAVKRSGGGGHAVFDPRIEAAHSEEAVIARELQHAVVKRQLELFYQPRIDAKTLQVTAVEALLRWRHPTLGLVSPARFIPIAERHGLIETIGGWVLDAALKQAAGWRAGGLRMHVAVNVAGAQFRQDDFAARLERGLKSHGVPADTLSCELTQAVAMENTEATRKAFARLGKLGVPVSIDDFAAGAAGLAAVAHQPVRELKIDRATVAALAHSTEARSMVECAVQAARALGLRVVAEGVETEAQRDAAVLLGCDELQGYLFAKPMSARAVAIWAADAPATLAQTFQPTAFKDTLPMDGRAAPQAFAQTRISLQR